MDILSHTCTGLAVGTVVAAWNNEDWRTSLSIIAVGGFGGALPDLDAFSLWSKFDQTIGALFGLKVTGKQIYFGKYWYSHHAALHSLVAPIFLLCFFLLFKYLWNRQVKVDKAISVKPTKNLIYRSLSFVIGFWFHLLEDMPTPASVWGGVNLLFPSKGYIGGFGEIWWWNNYDIFLIICVVILLNLCLLFLIKFNKAQLKSTACSITFCIGVVMALFQMNTRSINFAYKGHTANYQMYEKQSKEIQKDILGEKVYGLMEAFDRKLPVHF